MIALQETTVNSEKSQSVLTIFLFNQYLPPIPLRPNLPMPNGCEFWRFFFDLCLIAIHGCPVKFALLFRLLNLNLCISLNNSSFLRICRLLIPHDPSYINTSPYFWGRSFHLYRDWMPIQVGSDKMCQPAIVMR